MAEHGWWRQLRRHARRRHTPGTPNVSTSAVPSQSAPPLSRLTMAQLCALWRKSWAGLRGASTPSARAQVVSAREALLDELERREPQAMDDWLTSGGADPDGPSVYLVRTAGPRR